MSFRIKSINTLNEDFFRYKSNFATVVLLLSYTLLHLKLTGVFTESTLEQFINFSVRLPYGQRLLIPALAHLTAKFLPVSTEEIFLLLEWLVNCLVYFAIYHLVLYEFSRKQAKLLSWLFILLLPLVSVINYRYPLSGEAPFYFPYDSATLFFTAAGMLLCLQSRWYYFAALVFIATFNRESSILLVLLVPVLHWSKSGDIIKPFLLGLGAYLAARLLVIMLVNHFPGQFYELYYLNTLELHFKINLMRLLNQLQLFLFPFYFACLPLFWFAFYDYIPKRYHPLRYLLLAYFLGLLTVGNIIESRIFGEIVVLLYLPVCTGLYRWLTDQKKNIYANAGKMIFYIDRYAIIAILFLIILLQHPLTLLILRITHP